MFKFRILFIAVVVLLIQSATAQTDSLLLRLKSLPNVVEVNQIKANKLFKATYVIMIDQLVDHNNPASQHFKQRVVLSHIDFAKPLVFVTEGYQADYALSPYYSEELSHYLNANQIVVEHRYFGKSVPSPLDWKYMNVAQAAADHHAILTIFKALYPGKWISTGISKGGQTSIYFRYFYPNDVDATVAYVAPINFALEDPREEDFLNKVGDQVTRDKIFDFQQRLFERKKVLLPEFEKRAAQNKDTFNRLGVEVAFDQMILEYPFSFWQWGHGESEIAEADADSISMLNALYRVVPSNTFCDQEIVKFEPFFAQANNELGYYGYDIKPFQKWVKQKRYPNSVLGPVDLPVNYSSEMMKKVDYWLQNKANKLICVYGQYDPWFASAAQIDHNPNTLKMVVAKGSHASRIATLSPEQKTIVFAKLSDWLGFKIK
jgi:hypothetical protein